VLLIAGQKFLPYFDGVLNFFKYLKLLLVNYPFSSGTPEDVQRKRGWEALS